MCGFSWMNDTFIEALRIPRHRKYLNENFRIVIRQKNNIYVTWNVRSVNGTLPRPPRPSNHRMRVRVDVRVFFCGENSIYCRKMMKGKEQPWWNRERKRAEQGRRQRGAEVQRVFKNNQREHKRVQFSVGISQEKAPSGNFTEKRDDVFSKG